MSSLEQMITSMKKSVMERCKDRIESARANPKQDNHEEENSISSKYKRIHGL